MVQTSGLISRHVCVRITPLVPAIATCIEQANSTNVKPAAKFARLRAKRAPCSISLEVKHDLAKVESPVRVWYIAPFLHNITKTIDG